MKPLPPKLHAVPNSERLKSSAEWKQVLSTLEAAKSKFELSRVLFPKQLGFGSDLARQVSACTTRRAGKSTAASAKLLDVALRKPNSVALYITTSRVEAKRLLWGILKGQNEEYRLGGIALEADLCLAMPNGSRIFLSGASHEGEIEKFRGLALSIAIIDEAQKVPQYMSRLIDEVLAPALMDFAGQLVLIGTPGPVPAGYFFDVCNSPQWSHHVWSVTDNPWIERKSGQSPQALLEHELARRGVTKDDAVIRREWFGEWALDTSALVFQFDAKRNTKPAPECTSFVIGIDLGFDDADAIAVLGWNDDSPDLFLVHEWVGTKQTISKLMAQVEALHTRYQPLAVVADTGGLGKKIAEELIERTGIPVEAADKARKLEHVELLNDALRTGRMHAPADSRFAQDCQLVEWDRSTPERPKISDRFHSDICDAVLYAWRRCQQWLFVEPPPRPPPLNTTEWHAAQLQAARAEVEAMWQQQMEANQRQQREENEWND